MAVFLVALSGCGLGEPTRASLSEEEAGKLRLPGSLELVSHGGRDAERTPEGPFAAIAWREHGVDASWDEVVAYFEAELAARGWEDGGGTSGIRSTREWDAIAWHTDDRILRLSHRRDASVTELPQFFRTIYRVGLLGKGLPSD